VSFEGLVTYAEKCTLTPVWCDTESGVRLAGSLMMQDFSVKSV
jgi:hypothetical protein